MLINSGKTGIYTFPAASIRAGEYYSSYCSIESYALVDVDKDSGGNDKISMDSATRVIDLYADDTLEYINFKVRVTRTGGFFNDITMKVQIRCDSTSTTVAPHSSQALT